MRGMIAKPSILRGSQQQGSHKTHSLFRTFFCGLVTRLGIAASSQRKSDDIPLLSGNCKHVEKHTGEHTADEWTNNGNRRIPPVRAAFPGNRENRVRDARSEVSCGLDAVTGRSSNSRTDAPHTA